MLLNPYVLLGAGVLAVSLALGGFTFGVKYQRGQEARAVLLVEKVREQARQGAAEEIAKIKVVNTTIKQQLETRIREHKVYSDCRADPDTVRLLNDALAGRSSGPVGSGVLSGAEPTN